MAYKLPGSKNPLYCILSLHKLAEYPIVYAFIPRKYVFSRSHPRQAGYFASEYKLSSGATIVELITVFGIVAFVSVLVASLYLTNYRLFSNQNKSFDLNSQNKIAVDEITNQIRQSQAITATCCNGESTGSTELVLQLWPLDTNNDPFNPNGAAYDYVVYKQKPNNNTQLQKIIVPDATSHRPSSTKIIATSLSANGLQFTYNNVTPSQASEVTIAIATTGTLNGKTQTVSQTGNGTLRNK